MTALTFASDTPDAIPLAAVASEAFEDWRAALPEAEAAWLKSTGFDASAGKTAVIPDAAGGIARGAGEPAGG